MNADILRAIQDKDTLWRKCRRSPQNAQLKTEYRCARNRANALLRATKRRHFQNELYRARSNAAKTWSLLNQLRGKTPSNSVDEELEKAFGPITCSVVDKFNETFAQFLGVPQNDVAYSIHSRDWNMASAFLPKLSEYDLKSLLLSFKPRKSPGVDNIRPNDLIRNFDGIKHVLLHMLNGFIAQRKIPNSLKNAKVKPLHKGGDRRKVENYRPISILSCISQILEKHLFQVMSQFLEKFEIISNNQYGFVNGHTAIT